MAQDITLLGASYSDVPAVLLPKTGGGSARFTDVTDTTASASDVAAGKLFFTALGALTTGTGSGGGGGGLEYETGKYIPEEDVGRPTLEWAKTHTEAPVLILFSDMTGADVASSSNLNFMWCDFYKMWGYGIPYSGSEFRYAIAYYTYRNTSSLTTGAFLCTNNSDSTSASSSYYPRYWASPTDFHPYSNSSSRKWRANREYKWIAVWKP